MGDVIRRNYQGLHRVLSMLSHAAQKGEIWAKSKQKTSDFQHISVRDARRASRTEFARAFDREMHSKKIFHKNKTSKSQKQQREIQKISEQI